MKSSNRHRSPARPESETLGPELQYLKMQQATHKDDDADDTSSSDLDIAQQFQRQACGKSLLRTCVLSMSLYAPFLKSEVQVEFRPAKAIVSSIAQTATYYAWSHLADALNKSGSKMTVHELASKIRECRDTPGPMPVLEGYGLPRVKVLLGYDCYLQDLVHTCHDSDLCMSIYGSIVDTTNKPGPGNFAIENIVVESPLRLDLHEDHDNSYEAAGNIEHFEPKDWTVQYRRKMGPYLEASMARHNERVAIWLGKQIQARLSDGEGVESLVPDEEFGQHFVDPYLPYIEKFLKGAMDQTRECFMRQKHGRRGM